MPDLSNLFKSYEGKPVRSGAQTITVISKSLQIRIPGLAGGLAWNRPSAVRVETEGAGEVVLPVVDETRRLEIGLLALAIAGSILLSMLLARR